METLPQPRWSTKRRVSAVCLTLLTLGLWAGSIGLDVLVITANRTTTPPHTP